jgi:FkbM family methyltransferase
VPPSRETRRLKPRTRWRRFRTVVSALGLRSALAFLLYPRLRRGRASTYLIHPRRALHPVSVRSGSSDIDAFRQIFVDREYACLDDLRDVRLVVDCGANVGYSSAYFLSQFPNCQVIAVEPDADNFAMLRRNLAAYGPRATAIRAGVWSHPARLIVSAESYRDGREWARQVRLCRPDEEADIDGVDVASILAGSGHARISLLKVDVEGAEAVVFAENYADWLHRVDAIAIELHDDSVFGNGSDVFRSAIRGQGFHVSENGELTICRRADG